MENQKSKNPKAFACASVNGHQAGMELRDYFAAKALNGRLAAESRGEIIDTETAVQWAEESYILADAMLKVREK